jgi:hypothetical protein
MSKKLDHVIVRDGSDSRGGPPPRIPERPSKPKEHPPAPKVFGPPYSTETSVVGKTEIDRKTFEGIGTDQTPRHKLPVTPSKGDGVTPAPID